MVILIVLPGFVQLLSLPGLIKYYVAGFQLQSDGRTPYRRSNFDSKSFRIRSINWQDVLWTGLFTCGSRSALYNKKAVVLNKAMITLVAVPARALGIFLWKTLPQAWACTSRMGCAVGRTLHLRFESFS